MKTILEYEEVPVTVHEIDIQDCPECKHGPMVEAHGEWMGETEDPKTGKLRGHYYFSGLWECLHCGAYLKLHKPYYRWE